MLDFEKIYGKSVEMMDDGEKWLLALSQLYYLKEDCTGINKRLDNLNGKVKGIDDNKSSIENNKKMINIQWMFISAIILALIGAGIKLIGG